MQHLGQKQSAWSRVAMQQIDPNGNFLLCEWCMGGEWLVWIVYRGQSWDLPENWMLV